MAKKNKKFKVLSLLFLSLVLSSVGVSAVLQKGNMQNEDVLEAIENEDFDAWEVAMTESINEETFDNIIENHKRISNNNHSEILDLREITRSAINENDYEAYLLAIEEYDGTIPNKILTEDDFSTLVEINSLRLTLDTPQDDHKHERMDLFGERKRNFEKI